MAWVTPGSPNIQDFWTFCYLNGVTEKALPKPAFTVTDGGSGYTTAPTVTVDAPTIGIAMTATASIAGGIVTSITADNPGTNYASIPGVTIAAPVSGTTATATISSLGSPWPASVLNTSMKRTINSTGGTQLLGELGSYTEACYNLGFHMLLLFAQDQPGIGFFQQMRSAYGLLNFRPGVVMAAGDQATSQTFIVPRFFQEITMEALEATKTPWGRQWVEYQQMYGQTVWDMS